MKASINTLTIVLFAFLGIVLLSFMVATVYLFLENGGLKKNVSSLNETLKSTQYELEQTKSTLAITTTNLNQKNSELLETSSRLGDVSTQLNSTKIQLQQKTAELTNASMNIEDLTAKQKKLNETMKSLTTELSAVEENIKDSISWFKSNADFSDNFIENTDVGYFVSDVEDYCIKNEEVNLACLSFSMEKQLGFRYISEGADRLFSLDEIVNNHGGDCEDFSLFTKALLNYLKKQYDINELALQGWGYKSGSQMTIYDQGTSKWYMPNAEEHYVGNLMALYPAAFCFTVECDINDVCEGHCVVGMTKERIESIEDMTGLSGSVMFEPQNGAYLGSVGNGFSVCNKYISDCGDKANHIWLVIGDEDLYIFKDDKWTNYKYYLTKIEDLRKETEE